jgi:asparagine synthase (glutamine-hydrolysing)
MCGIAGFIDCSRTLGSAALQDTVMRMANTLHHRGPDDEGCWVDAETGLALGFRRLSIIDLSPEGHQPMLSATGRYIVAFNGEIYNHADLRQELSDGRGDTAFRGHSDTEVMLAAIERWGMEQAVRRFVGMFAFAVWDRQERLLYLGRDRIGEKPLFYGWMAETFLFGSELKALRAHPAFRSEIDRDALASYTRYGYVPAPYAIYKSIHKLIPGTLLTLNPSGDKTLPSPRAYWSPTEIAEAGAADSSALDETAAADQLESLLRQAIRQQMVADVPLGAFLSGGIDSSTVVALMQAQSTRPVKTFAIGFHEADYNEAVYAQAVARHLGTEHTELYVTPAEAMGVICKLPSLYDEPFGDSSQIPTFLVSQLARRKVTVSLSGDGGDELFAGYSRYTLIASLWNKIRWMPFPLRHATAGVLDQLASPRWDRTFNRLQALLPLKRERYYPFGRKARTFADLVATVESPEGVYHSWLAKTHGSPVLGATPRGVLSNGKLAVNLANSMQRLMFFDMISYLPDDILVKVDRASMGVSLESRAPFLDHRVVEFAWRVPVSMKVRHGQRKWLLRQVLYRYVPPELVERPKVGFSVPMEAWLRGPLSEWAESLINEVRLRKEGFFEVAPIRNKWEEHLAGDQNWQSSLWNVLMFQAWLETQ